jgi:hypothetical protein
MSIPIIQGVYRLNGVCRHLADLDEVKRIAAEPTMKMMITAQQPTIP